MQIEKISKYQVKPFGSTKPVDVIGDVHDFSFQNIEESMCNPNSNHNHSSIFDDSNSSYKLDKTSWINKHQHTRALRNPDTSQVDTTSNTNNQGRPLGQINGADGEMKSFLVLTSLLLNERLRPFHFMLMCMGFMHRKSCM